LRLVALALATYSFSTRIPALFKLCIYSNLFSII
jgi:hypothetical protein